ncbi:MAG: hypothetical protein NVS1B11_24850 [Terriglobales bacterium]
MQRLCSIILLITLGLLAGCSSGGNNPGGGAVSVSISPSSTVSVGVNLTQQFTATVTNTSNTAVNWSVAGSGCSGAACGSISSNGLYTAPATPPSPATVTVTATSAADSTKSAKVSVQIVSIAVTVAPKTVTVALNGTQQFVASATPSGAPQTFNWSVSCTGSPCGTVDSTGLYTAPATIPSPATVTVTATSTISSTATDHATVTLVTSFNSRLSGTYAFRFSGFDAAGPVLAVGNIVADGSGNISAGSEDISRTTGLQTLAITGGLYSVGTDNRGTLTLTTSASTSTYKFAIGSSGETLFVEFDGTGTRGSGVLDLATVSSFKNSALSTPYAFGFSGADATGKRAGYVGVVSADGAGNITSGSLDINDAGIATTSSSVSGIYNIASSGRGTMTLSVSSVTKNFAFYLVSSSEIFFISTDPVAMNPRVSGVAINQNVSQAFTNAAFNGSSVFYLTGADSTGAFSNVVMGVANTDGNGNITGTFDENNAGSITGNTSFTGTYSATGNGRYTATLFSTPVIIYAVTANKGFVQDQSSPSVTNGLLEPQRNSPFSAASIGGTFVAGTLNVATSAAQDIEAALSLNSTAGTISGTQDETDGGQNANQALTGTYTVTANGRGTLTLSSPSGAPGRVIYVINNSKFVAMGVDATDKNSAIFAAER